MLHVVELFAGIGAQASALERLGIPFTSTVSEIDPHAYSIYCAIHGDAPNLGDITKVQHLPECDLLTFAPTILARLGGVPLIEVEYDVNRIHQNKDTDAQGMFQINGADR